MIFLNIYIYILILLAPLIFNSVHLFTATCKYTDTLRRTHGLIRESIMRTLSCYSFLLPCPPAPFKAWSTGKQGSGRKTKLVKLIVCLVREGNHSDKLIIQRRRRSQIPQTNGASRTCWRLNIQTARCCKPEFFECFCNFTGIQV